VNHNGDPELAHKLIDIAADAKADAVKFQTFKAELLVTAQARKAAYQTETTGGGSQSEMLKRLELPESAWAELKQHCGQRGLMFLSTPFDDESLELLVSLGVDALKLGSGDTTNRPLIEHCALSGLPLILSTGMCNRHEVASAVAWFRLAFQHRDVVQRHGRVKYADGGRIGLMHCVSSYPAAATSLNLRAIGTMKWLTRLPIGYSDHSEGLAACPLAVAAGACMLEKHFTISRDMEGPDHRASLEPEELAELVRAVRRTEDMLGHGRKEPDASELDVREVARRSVVALVDIPEGALIGEGMVGVRRPGTGMAPAHLYQVIGSRTRRAVTAGEPIQSAFLDIRPSDG
jgi:sialic acid synthase SpsE